MDLRLLLIALCLNWWACDRDPQISFNRDIRPILNEKCLRCHGGVKANGDLSFIRESDVYAATQSGRATLVPGSPGKSEMYRRLIHPDPELRMPYQQTPLSSEEIETIRKWISQGAKWETHWAYEKPKSTTPPEVPENDFTRTELDQFIYHQLQQRELPPSPEADRLTLLRRLSLDLTGLPPNQELKSNFLRDTSALTFDHLVDNLLQSPHFGERWASMWLDLARYADTKGYEKDSNRQIWKFRDYVIQALNDDKPFDQFTIEQLAGDLLPNPSRPQLIATAFHRNSMSNDEGGTDDEEFRVASVIERVNTTYETWLATTMACVQCHSHPYDPFDMDEYYKSLAYFNNVEDRDIYHEAPKIYEYHERDSVKVSELIRWIEEKTGLESAPHTGIFESGRQLMRQLDYRVTEAENYDLASPLIELIWPELDMLWQVQDSSWVRFDEISLTGVEQIGFRVATPLTWAGGITVHLDSLNGKKIGEVKVTRTGDWDNWQGNKPVRASVFRELITDIEKIEGQHTLFFRFWLGDTYIQHLFYLDKITYYEKEPLYKKFGAELENKLKQLYDIPVISTPIIRELPADRSRKTHLFDRGSWLVPTNEIFRAVPAVFEASTHPTDRLQFASWLVSGEHPMTARVLVNRIWEQVFGYGLVETMEEFGTQGSGPSHPELLDWLAIRLVETHNWRIKPLIRDLVTSATYRQSSYIQTDHEIKDPENRWLARSNRIRLSSEQLRDQILAVTGVINLQVGGPPVITPELRVPKSFIPSWAITDSMHYHRRSLYLFWRRTEPFANMLTFDSPDRTVCQSRRIRTNTPLQALNMLNDQRYFEAVTYFAAKILESGETLDEQISEIYETSTVRRITHEKLLLLKNLYVKAYEEFASVPEKTDSLKKYRKNQQDRIKVAALSVVINAVFNLDEFLVKY